MDSRFFALGMAAGVAFAIVPRPAQASGLGETEDDPPCSGGIGPAALLCNRLIGNGTTVVAKLVHVVCVNCPDGQGTATFEVDRVVAGDVGIRKGDHFSLARKDVRAACGYATWVEGSSWFVSLEDERLYTRVLRADQPANCYSQCGDDVEVFEPAEIEAALGSADCAAALEPGGGGCQFGTLPGRSTLSSIALVLALAGLVYRRIR